MAEVLFRARLTRDNSSVPWGFRLQGGANFDRPLTLLKVVENSVAAKSGLQAGDILVKLAGRMAHEMTHKDAQEVIRASQDALEIIVERAEEVAMSKPSSASPEEKETTADDQEPAKQTNDKAKAQKNGEATPSHSDSPSAARKEASEKHNKESEKAAPQNSPGDTTNADDLSNQLPSASQGKGPAEELSEEQLQIQKRLAEIDAILGGERTKDVANATSLNSGSVEVSGSLPNVEVSGSLPNVEVSGSLTAGSKAGDHAQNEPNTTPVNSHDKEAPHTKQSHISVVPMPAPVPLPDSTVQSVQMSVAPPVLHPGYTPVSAQSSTVAVHTLVSPMMSQSSPASTMSVQSHATAIPTALQQQPGPPHGASTVTPVSLMITPASALPTISPNLQPSVTHMLQPASSHMVQPAVSHTVPQQHIPYHHQAASGQADYSLGNTSGVAQDSNQSHDEKQLTSANEDHNVRLKPEDDPTDGTVGNIGITRHRKYSEGSGVESWTGNSSADSSVTPSKRHHPVLKSLKEAGRSRSLDSDSRSEPNKEGGLYPWRRPKAHDESNRVTSSRTIVSATVEAPIDVTHSDPIKPSLKLVGKRIEAGVGVPSSGYSSTMEPTSYASHSAPSNFVSSSRTSGYDPSQNYSQSGSPSHAPSHGTVGSQSSSSGHPSSYPIYVKHESTEHGQTLTTSPNVAPIQGLVVLPVEENQKARPEQGPSLRNPQEDRNPYIPPGLDDIYFAAADPDLVEIPMPAVKEMVADLNRRLETIAAQHPHLADSAEPHDLGQSYVGKAKDVPAKTSGADKEIFIDTPPASELDVLKHRIFGGESVDAPYQKIYDVKSPLSSPTPQRKMYITTDLGKGQPRKVHFAEPIEQSVHEIPRSERREKRREMNRQLERELQTLGSVRDQAEAVKAEIDMAKQHLLSISQQTPGRVPTTRSLSTTPVSVIHSHSGVIPTTMVTAPRSTQQRHSVSGDSLPGGGISVSISHRKSAGATQPTQTFTLPAAQPGQPQRFRYTISGRKSSQPFAINYSFPPTYEESLRIRRGRQRSLDESMASVAHAAAAEHYLRTASGPLSPTLQQRAHYMDTWPRREMPGSHFHPGTLAPQQYIPGSSLSPSPESMQSRTQRALETQAYARTSPLMSPTQPFNTSPHGSSSPSSTVGEIDPTQSKSFKALEAHLTEGGRHRPQESIPLRVQVLGQPSHVLQPAAVGRPFTPSFGGLREESSPELYPVPQAQGRRLSAPVQPMGAMGSHAPPPELLAQLPPGTTLMPGGVPGVFALFDKAFAEKVLQWQGQGRRSHFQSETYKLVHEMDDIQRKHGGGPGSQSQ